MKPVEFPEQNMVFVANGCEDLPGCRLKNEKFGTSEVISCWELEEKDIRLVLDQIASGETPKIYLSCMGGQPPVWLYCGSPFVKVGE